LPAPESPSIKVSDPNGTPPPILLSRSALPVEIILLLRSSSLFISGLILVINSAGLNGLMRKSSTAEPGPISRFSSWLSSAIIMMRMCSVAGSLRSVLATSFPFCVGSL
jgi:hypothetical protein